MKKLLLFGTLAFGLNAAGQNMNGTYVNAVGQKLVITNEQECCFDFKVTWGLNDEWGCLFTGAGTATYTDANSAYSGEDSDWADIEFNINGNSITVWGGLGYIGDDCAKFGDSSEETYTQFKK
ncbi:hypothetical protein N9I21_04835 [Crocinitomicaceae bacterium]|nr:hypothetical protein [Crocinitomicaceae bacterium]